MKEQILKLRQEGKTYKEIKELLKCSLSTISYYCGKGQKEKNNNRAKKRKSSHTFIAKVDRFKHRSISEKSRCFQRRLGSKLIPREEYNFDYKDLIEKFGESPKCYLSGKDINLSDGKSYHMDHIIPASKGGNNLLENVGLLDASVNKMKHDLTVNEFLEKCKEILLNQGYEITRRSD